MKRKTVCLAGAALVAIAAPAAALADPYWGGHDGWRAEAPNHQEWREHQWRDHEWREHRAWDHETRDHETWDHEAWERRAAWGWDAPPPRCVVETRGHYDWDGNYVYQPVRVCYR